MNIEVARTRARDALRNLESHRVRINDLNVYPVPDGDTGTNLTLTMRSIVEALDASRATGHEAVAKELSRAALMGARGNSGVILSQIVRGLASVLGEQDEIDSKVIARALRAASDEAYRAIQTPVEGTMLTVIREMAEEAERPDVIVLPKVELLLRVVERGEDAVRRTPDMLAKLRDAGVVDAGGVGLVELVRGIYFSVAGIAVPDEAELVAEDALPESDHEFSEFQFCTNFVVEGRDLDREALSDELWRFGDSLHVVGDPSMLRVHVHTDEPARALETARGIGTVIESTVDVADMDEQIRERMPDLRTAVIAVASGEGNRRLFGRTFGEVVVVAGGQSANPSAKEIAEAVDAAHAPEAIVLPNNPNVVGAAIQAGEFTSKPTRVVETRSVQAGLHAVSVGYRHNASADENVEEMNRAIDEIRTGEVTTASRTAAVDGVTVTAGEWLGLVDGHVVASAPGFDEVALAVADGVLSDGSDTLTAILGADVPPLDGLLARLAEAHPRVHVERVDGGQPHYPLLVIA
jgi:DAK2 domain fusion protein YloV